MKSFEVREYINENYYKIKINKYFTYYNKDNEQITLDYINNDLQETLGEKLSKVSLIKYIKIKENKDIMNVKKNDIIEEFKIIT
jgi:hypothetical protein